MIKFYAYQSKGKILRKMVVEHLTPSKQDFPLLNREQRRALKYRLKNNRLQVKISELRKEMKQSGFKLPPIYNHHKQRRKWLSGYWGQLVEIVRNG